MEFIDTLQIGKWIILLIIYIIILSISLAGRISPKLSLLLMATLFGITCLIGPHADKIVTNDPISVPETVSTEDTISIERPSSIPKKESVEKKQDSNSTNHRQTNPQDKTEPKRLVPDAYEVRDPKFRTYSAKGNWNWSSLLVEAIEQELGWIISKNGNYTISVDYPESFIQNTEHQTRLFVHSGGEIEINVNGELCCCTGLVVIPNQLSGTSLKEVRLVVQDTVTQLIHENQSAIIQKIKECLQSPSASF